MANNTEPITMHERRLYNAYVKQMMRDEKEPLPVKQWLKRHRGESE